MAKDLRAHWGGLIGASLAVLAAAFIAPRFVTPPDLQENRPLAPAPQTPRTWAEWRAWPKAADAYVADRFPARPHLIGWLNFLRLKAGVSGSPSVIVGRDGWLFFDNGTHLGAARNDPAYTDAQAREWLAALAGRSEAAARAGAVHLVIVPPDKEVVYPQHGPAWYAGPDRNRAAVLLSRLAERSGAGDVLYLQDVLRRPTRWGLRTYGVYDTHWTGLGAYHGYAEMMRRLQAMGLAEGPRPIEAFADLREHDPNKPRNLALMLGVASFVAVDFPELGDPDAEDRLKTTWLTPNRDWTAPQVVDTGEVGKPVLLMTRDSFSTAFLPFLYTHFSRIVLAHNQDGSWRGDLIERFKPDIVVLEVVEGGLPVALGGSPPASPEALRRIDAALAEPHRIPAAEAIEPSDAPGRIRTLSGGPGPDRLRGSEGGEFILGRGGDDVIEGRGGADTIRAGMGADRIDGGPGGDWISGDKGDDEIRGGPGADVFVSRSGAGLDLVLDFSLAEGDRVVVEPGSAFVVAQEGPDAVVRMDGARLVLKGVRAADLPPGTIARR